MRPPGVHRDLGEVEVRVDVAPDRKVPQVHHPLADVSPAGLVSGAAIDVRNAPVTDIEGKTEGEEVALPPVVADTDGYVVSVHGAPVVGEGEGQVGPEVAPAEGVADVQVVLQGRVLRAALGVQVARAPLEVLPAF